MGKIRICVDARILHIASNGISRYVRETVYELCKYKNIEIHLISNKKIIIDQTLLSNNVHLIEDVGKIAIPGTIWLHLFMNRHLEIINPDIYWGPNQILPYHKKKNIKYIMAAHDLVHVLYPETMTFLNKMIFNLSYGRSVKHADRVLTISQTTRTDFLKFNGQHYADKVQNIYLGGAEKFQKNALFDQKQEKSIFVLGSLEPRKNIKYLLDVFEKALDVDTALKLYITGAEKWKSKDIIDRIASDKLKNNVFLLGYLTDQEIEDYLNKCKLFAFPSVYEGLGLPLIEAQAKTLIVASKIPVFEELSQYFENLNFLDLNQSLSVNAAQLIALMDVDEITQLKKDVYEMFTWHYMAQEMYKVMISLAAETKDR